MDTGILLIGIHHQMFLLVFRTYRIGMCDIEQVLEMCRVEHEEASFSERWDVGESGE